MEMSTLTPPDYSPDVDTSLDPDALCDTFFISKCTTLLLYRVEPNVYNKIVGSTVVSLTREKAALEFKDGRFPVLGEKITKALADELRRHPLLKQGRFSEYVSRPIPAHEARDRILTDENLKLHDQLEASQKARESLAQQLELALQASGVKRTHMDKPPSVQYAKPTAPEKPTTPAQLQQERDEESTPEMIEVEGIKNKGDALDALSGLSLPVEELGDNPRKDAVLVFAHSHNVKFPGYDGS